MSLKAKNRVRNLRVICNSYASFKYHTSTVCQNTLLSPQKCLKLHDIISIAYCEKQKHFFVSSILDYCNAILSGLPRKSIMNRKLVQKLLLKF